MGRCAQSGGFLDTAFEHFRLKNPALGAWFARAEPNEIKDHTRYTLTMLIRYGTGSTIAKLFLARIGVRGESGTIPLSMYSSWLEAVLYAIEQHAPTLAHARSGVASRAPHRHRLHALTGPRRAGGLSTALSDP
jgi:hypothetical protein